MKDYEGIYGKYEGICQKYEEICQNMQEYEGNTTEYVENMKEYVKNMKKYVKNMKKYVNILGLALPYLYGPWDLEKFRILPLYMGLGTWKSFTPKRSPGLRDSEKFQALPLYRLIQALGLGKIARRSLLLSSLGLGKILSSASIQVLGFEKMLRLPFPSITACWRSTERSEVRGVFLLSPPVLNSSC